MLYCENGARHDVIEAMEGEGLYRMEFRFEDGGARVLVNNLTGPGSVYSPLATVLAPPGAGL
jgi:hypothetical protein